MHSGQLGSRTVRSARTNGEVGVRCEGPAEAAAEQAGSRALHIRPWQSGWGTGRSPSAGEQHPGVVGGRPSRLARGGRRRQDRVGARTRRVDVRPRVYRRGGRRTQRQTSPRKCSLNRCPERTTQRDPKPGGTPSRRMKPRTVSLVRTPPKLGMLSPCRRSRRTEPQGAAAVVAASLVLPRATPRSQDKLLEWLRHRPVTTVHALWRQRFTLRMIATAEREGFVDPEQGTGRVAMRSEPTFSGECYGRGSLTPAGP
jgi:hypothetical protein